MAGTLKKSLQYSTDVDSSYGCPPPEIIRSFIDHLRFALHRKGMWFGAVYICIHVPVVRYSNAWRVVLRPGAQQGDRRIWNALNYRVALSGRPSRSLLSWLENLTWGRIS